ncbi:hypothetical protein JJL45_05120 [Tamlana sp. s12]|uniref:hypothetical protein n=1 Tax=Tamlana sp. s12 TaxID=1630406 RepID=UPI0008011FD8|nr:hypothetical protein [Tamlana sp. s12]OBQ56115.1 hypothetical protein VQ01_06940 [Tamlana sp. s12]QQY83372.1 hypothetical protein JJL45_05120 [Tamlana sp. s12]
MRKTMYFLMILFFMSCNVDSKKDTIIFKKKQRDSVFTEEFSLPEKLSYLTYEKALKMFLKDSILASKNDSIDKIEYLSFKFLPSRKKRGVNPKVRTKELDSICLAEVLKEIEIKETRRKEREQMQKLKPSEYARIQMSGLTNEMFKSKLSNWDGSLPSLVEYTKKNLHNPDSFKHVETGFIIRKEYVEVKMIYRAENGFGAIRKSYIVAKSDRDGKIFEIIDSN